MYSVDHPSILTKDQARIAVRSAIVITVALFLISIFSVIFSLPIENLGKPAILIADLIPLAGSGLALFSGWVCWYHRKRFGVHLLVGTFLITIFAQSLITSGLGIWLALTAIILIITIVENSLPPKQSSRLVGLGVTAAIAIILTDLYYPLPRLSVGQYLQTATIVILGLAIAIHVIFIVQQFSNYTLHAKLITILNSLALAAIFILGLFFTTAMRNALTQSTNKTLQIAAQQTANNIDGYYKNLITTLQTEAAFPAFRDYLALGIPKNSIEEYRVNQLISSFHQSSAAMGYSVLSIAGTVLMDTGNQNSSTLGYSIIPTSTYTSSLVNTGYYLSPVIFPTNSTPPYFFVMTRINNDQGQFIGILMVRYPASVLQSLISESSNLTGSDSFAILWDENRMRLANGITSTENYKVVETDDSFNTVLNRISKGYLYFNALDNRLAENQSVGERKLIGAGAKTIYQPWVVTFVQSESVALGAIPRQTRAIVVMAIIIVMGVSFLGLFITQAITRPIIRLTQTAEKITQGEIDAQAVVGSKDEIGTLASAFNIMTAQLRQTLAGLEKRVDERTTELVKASEQMATRAAQLQSVAEVAHTISGIKDPQQLLEQITTMISNRFGFYHVGVFLIDKAGEYAVLQAANSEGGKVMLLREHRLQVNETSMVGYVAKLGKARVALDVGKDAVYFNNPDLPLTRSEISLPLTSSGKVIGVLDVQSVLASAFGDEDVALLSTLADQVSIAIENARLFSEINQTVDELQSLQRQYVQQEWQRIVAEELQSGFKYSNGKITPLSVDQHEQATESGEARAVGLSVPITLRGQEIGAFNLEETDTDHQWAEDEIAIVKTIADQVALALENARLLDASQRRSARDRMVAEITNKMRRAVDMDTLIQTAVREITNAINVPEAFIQLGVSPNVKDNSKNTHATETSDERG